MFEVEFNFLKLVKSIVFRCLLANNIENIKIAAYKETLAQGYSCEYCEIFKNTFFYRPLSVAAWGKIRTKPLKLAKLQI